jgi:Dolichyl-phosphate-mannose-protein mannosyltransferase
MTAGKLASQVENANVRAKADSHRVDLAFLALFTVIFAAGAVRGAMRKPPWVDEIVTVRLAALPFSQLWSALRAGADSAPPLSHILVGACTAMFGPTNIAIRIPSMAGFLIMSICLFAFVRRWAGPAIAAAAVLMVSCTSAISAAIEARAYGPLLGTSALSMLCWQRAIEGKSRSWWLAGLALSTAASASLHYYAPILYLPLVIAEAFHDVRLRRVDWPVWGAFLAGISIMVVYWPLMRGVAAVNVPSSTTNTYWAAATLSSLYWVFQGLFGPLIMPLVIVSIAIALALRTREAGGGAADEPREYWVLASGLVLLPYVLFAVCRLGHGAFAARYLLNTVLGAAVLFALIVRRLPKQSWVIAAAVAPLGMLALMHLTFPSAGSIATVQTVGAALQSPATRGLPIVIASANSFAAFMYNAPATMRERVYYVRSFTGEPIPGKDPTGERGLLAFVRWSPMPHIVDLGDLERQSREFFVYQEGLPIEALIPDLLRAGVEVRFDGGLPDSFVRVRIP